MPPPSIHNSAIPNKAHDDSAVEEPVYAQEKESRETHPAAKEHYLPGIATDKEQILVIGAGPVGVYFCNELLQRNPDAAVTLLGNEPYAPYNRVQLTGVLAREVQRHNIEISLPNKDIHPLFSYVVCNIETIDRDKRCIIDALGNTYYYDKLVLAVGAYPIVPNIEGRDLKGVYTFRNLKDTDALYARLASARHVVVVGGGVLGIEAAKALSNHNTKVTLVQQGDKLMNRQLDYASAQMLKSTVAEQGITVKLGQRVKKIYGNARVEGVELYSAGKQREQLDCDTILFCTGVKPDTNLAARCKLDFGQGIKVNEILQTSDSHIYAIGECAEYNAEVWGLVAPGYEQAAILADRFHQGQSVYQGSTSLARLKVLEQNVCSIGDIEERPGDPGRAEIIYKDRENALYRKIILKRGRLVGAIGFGTWKELPRVQEALTTHRNIGLLRRFWFTRTGQLWPNQSEEDVRQWPAKATVCQCNSVTVETLLKAIDDGATSVQSLKDKTLAGTGCGSCQYLLGNLCSETTSPEKTKYATALVAIALSALLIAATQIFHAGFSAADSVQSIGLLEPIWNDKFYKQVTGFSLLGITAIAILLSLRKRIAKVSWGEYSAWRFAHTALGLAGIALVAIHTGFHSGANLNRYLAYDFIAVIVVGALAGIVVAQSHRLPVSTSKRLRDVLFWAHILVTWPLPVLLTMHIVSVYYF